MPSARISLTLSCHPSLSSIASVMSSRLHLELLYVGSSCSSCLCSSMWRGPLEYVTYEFVHTALTVYRMSASSNLDFFRDGWYAAVQLLLCGVLPPGLAQYCSQYSCVVVVKLFLHTFTQRPCSASISQYWPDRGLEKNWVLFYRSGLTSIWPIAYRWLSMA